MEAPRSTLSCLLTGRDSTRWSNSLSVALVIGEEVLVEEEEEVAAVGAVVGEEDGAEEVGSR